MPMPPWRRSRTCRTSAQGWTSTATLLGSTPKMAVAPALAAAAAARSGAWSRLCTEDASNCQLWLFTGPKQQLAARG
jgi:hypothetical protein